MTTINNAGKKTEIDEIESNTQSAEPIETPGTDPKEKPEVEPDVLPNEDPGIDPEPKPGREDDDDVDDTFTETEIGDDPYEIEKKTTIM